MTHVFVWFGFVFVCFVGIWLFGLLKWVEFVVFLGMVGDGCPWAWSSSKFFLPVLLKLGFSGILVSLLGLGLAFLLLVIWLVRCSILKVLFLKLGVIRYLRTFCCRKGFRGGPLLDVHGSLQLLLTSSHVRERDEALLRSIMAVVSGTVFFLVVFVVRLFHVGFVGRQMVMVIYFGNVPFLLL